jgi:hypothetical protein
MLQKQKISGKGNLEVTQVRTPEDLKRCDALIIPGGGLGPSISFPYVRAKLTVTTSSPHRVNHHRAARASVRFDGAAQGVRQDQIGVGDVRRCNTPFAGRVQSQERRAGAPGRRLSQDYEEWLGIAGASVPQRPFFVSGWGRGDANG